MNRISYVLKYLAARCFRPPIFSGVNEEYSGQVFERSYAEDYLSAGSDIDAIWYYERRRWKSQ